MSQQREDSSWSSEPVSLLQRRLGSGDLAALWVLLVLAAPSTVIGHILGALDLSLSQLVIAVPIGAVAGALLLAGVAWAGAYNGVPTLMSLRPAFGRSGMVIFGLLFAALLVGWSSVHLAALSAAVETAVSDAGIAPPYPAATLGAIALVAGTLVAVGMATVARVWSRVAFWVALGVSALTVWAVLNGADMSSLTGGEGTSAIWMGIDAVLALAILWFPVTADTARFAINEPAAVSGTTLGFGVTAMVVAVAVGVLVLLGGGPSALVMSLSDSLPGVGGLVVVLVWALVVQVVPISVAAYAVGMASVSLTGRDLGRVVALAAVAFMAILALVADPDAIIPALDLVGLATTSVAAVVLADFYLVRRRSYRTDQLYGPGGTYGTFNLWGWLAALVGFIAAVLVRPTGPQPLVGWVDRLFEGWGWLVEYSLPPFATALAVSGLLYAVLGSLLVREEVVVSRVRL